MPETRTHASGTAPGLRDRDSILETLNREGRPPDGHRGRVASNTRVMLADGIVLTREAIEAGERVAVVPYEVLE